MLSEAGPSPQGLWQLFFRSVEQKLSAHVFQTLLRPVHCTAFDGQQVTLEVRDQFFRDWLADHYLSFVRDSLGELLHHPVSIQLLVNPALPSPGAAAVEAPAPLEAPAAPVAALAREAEAEP